MKTSLVMAIAATALVAVAQDSRPAKPRTAAEAVARGVEYLLEHQNKDGSWGGTRQMMFTSSFAEAGTYASWQFATTGLVVRSLLECSGDERTVAAAKRGLDYLAARARLVRPAEWDVDNVWGLIYGLDGVSFALKDARLDDDAAAVERWRAAATTMVELLRRYQTPLGGWGYYADPISAWRPGWATSFTTAAGVLALREAKSAGIKVPTKPFEAAVDAVERAKLPSGAFSYDVSVVPRHPRLESIDNVKGSLGRIQIGNLVLKETGKHGDVETLKKGLDLFFEHHKFLDAARNKPIPHEAYYANAAYFYLFGHYYAARVIRHLPPEDRGRYVALLEPEVMKCVQSDGSIWDFWIAANTKCYGTAFGIMTLHASVAP